MAAWPNFLLAASSLNQQAGEKEQGKKTSSG